MVGVVDEEEIVLDLPASCMGLSKGLFERKTRKTTITGMPGRFLF